VELINSIFLDPSRYITNVTKIDYCANATLNACPNNKDCVDGLNPPYGYTCKKVDNTLLQVDYISNFIYDQLNSVLTPLGYGLVAIEDIIIDAVNVELIYNYQTVQPFSAFYAPILKSSAESSITNNFQSLVGVPMGQGRVVVTPSTTEAKMTIEFFFPALLSEVSWNSSTSGDTEGLSNILLTNAGLNASTLYAKMRLITEYQNATVYAKWLEDFAQPPGADTTYLELACTSYGQLLNGSLDITSSGFAFSAASLTISDSSCRYIPQPPPSPPPPSQPSSSNSVVVLWGIGLFSLLLSITYN